MKTKMSNSSVFIFQDNKRGGSYDLYLFKDFSGEREDDQEEIFNILDEIRQKIHSLDVIFILCEKQKVLDKNKIKSRFPDEQNIEYIDYTEIKPDVFQKGIFEIVKKNNVVQRAPYGTLFKKPSGAESNYFIKASLSLLEYSHICFLALATYEKIKPGKLSKIRNIYVDTSSIISLIQAMIHYYNIFKKKKYNPQIINFKSYESNNIDFNAEGSFTIISASSEGKLRENKNIDQDKCFTLFYPKDSKNKECCLFEIDNIIKNNYSSSPPRLIPLTSEDFSLEYSKSKEVIVTQQKVEKLDTKQIIKKILSCEFNDIDFCFCFDEITNNEHIKFNPKYIYKKLKDKFIKDTFTMSLLSEEDNYIIYDCEKLPNFKSEHIASITKNKFLDDSPKETEIDNKNVIVFLIQSTNNELIHISQKLRIKYNSLNITYIIGILATNNCHQSKNLENNICFNDTDYKYGFYCYLNLPIYGIAPIHDISDTDFKEHKLSKGFVFCDGNDSRKLGPKQVYLVICVILELLRSNHELNDNISYHDVLSPKNFSRFNDSLLQLSFLNAAKGRELNFQSNIELSREMKDVIMDLMKEKEDIGKIFIESIKNNRIKLTDQDVSEIEEMHSNLPKEEGI